jgi:hypothetical protein
MLKETYITLLGLSSQTAFVDPLVIKEEEEK